MAISSDKIPARATEDLSDNKIDLSKVRKDCLAGICAGVASVLSGHPLDTVKVRMQVLGDQVKSCVQTIVKKEGVTSFYKGVYSPLLSVPLLSAISFSSYGFAKMFLGVEKQEISDVAKYLMSGTFAGIVCASIVSPLDLIKCRLQMEAVGQKSKSSGMVKTAMQVIRTNGLRGMYRGIGMTLMRDIPGGAVVFTTYELLKKHIREKWNDSYLPNFFAGGISSCVTWFFCYPQDIIKTRLQTRNQGSVKEVALEIWRQYGAKGFYRGINVVLCRSLITGSFSFFAMENVKRLLQNNGY